MFWQINNGGYGSPWVRGALELFHARPAVFTLGTVCPKWAYVYRIALWRKDGTIEIVGLLERVQPSGRALLHYTHGIADWRPEDDSARSAQYLAPQIRAIVEGAFGALFTQLMGHNFVIATPP